MIHVIATIDILPGYKPKVLAELMKIQPQVLAEAGCYQYLPLEGEDSGLAGPFDHREDTITMLEQWESTEHLEAHLVTAHMKDYQDIVHPWVERVSIQVLRACE